MKEYIENYFIQWEKMVQKRNYFTAWKDSLVSA